ncbi:hypothetical protein GCM10023210_04350 [Chryseobacterium ginsengisoli]|uniref:Tail sheath protein C-terminal domain-containing protein n=1 Tax=Chryseobacterium ginsengisoli TaxID=363853 RepID=A0ABP9LX28_9FLAO
MPNPTTPGVSVKENAKLPYSIALVESSIPAFIGYTEIKPDSSFNKNKPPKISSLLEYEQLFGKAKEENIHLKDTEKGITAVAPSVKFLMYYSLQMYFANGGGSCYIVSVGTYTSAGVEKSFLESGISKLDDIADTKKPTLIVFPDAVSLANQDDFYSIYTKAIGQDQNAKNRFVILDTYYGNSTTLSGGFNTIDYFRNKISLTNLNGSYAAVYFPHLKTILNYTFNEKTFITHDGLEEGQVGDADGKKLEDLQLSDSLLYNQIKEAIRSLNVILPPSSAIAGIYAKVDTTKGVWKAPANVGLNYVIAPTEKLSDEEQSGLNIHETGKSINAIRSFTGKGTLVWGARTLEGKDKKEENKDNEWKYVHVRRYYNMLKQSIAIVLEENFIDEPNILYTWLHAKTTIENFLNQQWVDGALMGNSPKEAYKVTVGGTEDTSTMNVTIEVALVRPAEFIVLNFSHKLQQS